MNDRFFVGSDGDLYRDDNFARPFRPNFKRTHSAITSMSEFKSTLRAGAFAWPGGYPLYLVTSDGAALCFECAKEEFHQVCWSIRHDVSDGWKVVAADVNYEDSLLYCAHCDQQIAAAYTD